MENPESDNELVLIYCIKILDANYTSFPLDKMVKIRKAIGLLLDCLPEHVNVDYK